MGDGTMVAQKISSGKGLCFSFLIIIPAPLLNMVFCYVSQTDLKLSSCLSLAACGDSKHEPSWHLASSIFAFVVYLFTLSRALF